MVDIQKIVERTNFVRLHKKRFSGIVRDVPSDFRYFCIHPDGRVWAAYCTYYRYDWDHTHRCLSTDNVIFINGSPDKGYKYQVGCTRAPNRIDSYKNRKVKAGYVRMWGNYDKRSNYPEICETIDKILMWMELQR
jgi:hypothetical protein